MNHCKSLTCFVGSRLCDFCKKAVKVARRHLWSKCSLLVADGLSPLDLQVGSARHQQLQDYLATLPPIISLTCTGHMLPHIAAIVLP